MTTSVRVHVNGQYRATVVQHHEGRALPPVEIEGNYNGGSGEHTFNMRHPASNTFVVTEEYVQDADKRPA